MDYVSYGGLGHNARVINSVFLQITFNELPGISLTKETLLGVSVPYTVPGSMDTLNAIPY